MNMVDNKLGSLLKARSVNDLIMINMLGQSLEDADAKK
jgi:hypothetical protein